MRFYLVLMTAALLAMAAMAACVPNITITGERNTVTISASPTTTVPVSGLPNLP